MIWHGSLDRPLNVKEIREEHARLFGDDGEAECEPIDIDDVDDEELEF